MSVSTSLESLRVVTSLSHLTAVRAESNTMLRKASATMPQALPEHPEDPVVAPKLKGFELETSKTGGGTGPRE